MRTLTSLFTSVACGLAIAATASATPVTIDLAPNVPGPAGSGYANSFSYTSTEASVTVTGWSNKSNGNKAIAQDQVGKWENSGLGVENQNSPQHSVDNSNGDYDSLLFSFTKVVDVSGLGIGWYSGDADVSVLAYTGAAPFSGGLTGFGSNWTTLLNNGWSVVGNYNRNGNGSFAVNSADYKAQYWLVGAYNRAFGGTLSQNNDYFKLKTITFESVKVPESSTLFLVVIGLLGLVGARRRAA
ncbi:MAG TPA: exosortase-dependent surface protein XDP1 [Cellvibrio sp.]|nr:exosortase-dependent surface protein XDP1 [Cellvibrio sp.]